MPLEIERKFLVVGNEWRGLAKPVLLRQGYLNSNKHRTVRVRVADSRAWLTIKGISEGASRAEYEYEIPSSEANELLDLCERPLIEKSRHTFDVAGMTWEVDEFHGENQGLVLAEVELASADQAITLPNWVGKEVTEDPRYFNSSLAMSPYQTWNDSDQD